MAGLSSMSYISQTGLNWSGQVASTGVAAQNAAVNKPTQAQLSTGAANNAVGGANEIYSAVLQIAASGTNTINLQSFTDALGQATQTLVRCKAWKIQLLGTGQTSPDGSVSGNACSGIVVGNAGSNAFPFNLNAGTDTFTVPNGSTVSYDDQTAAGITVDATHKNVLITNSDSGNAANVVVSFVGGTS